MNVLRYLGCILFLLGFACQVNGSPFLKKDAILPPERAFVLSVNVEPKIITAQWHIAPNTYLYQDKLKFRLLDLQDNEIRIYPIFPKALLTEDPLLGKQYVYRLDASVLIPIPAETTEKNRLAIEYQGCADSGFCYPPQQQWFEIDHHTLTAYPINEPLKKAEKPLENKPLFSIVLTSYLLGILLTFTPCVLPMLPILFGIIVGEAHLNRKKAFWLSLIYVLSMAVTYATAGVIAATLGKNLQAWFQKPAAVISFAALFVYLGLSQLGIFQLRLSSRLHAWLHKHHANQESGSYIGAAVMGVLATLIASPCVTAPLIGTLSYISQSGNVMAGGIILFSLGLGMGTLLLVMGTLGGQYLPKTGPWMHTINQIFAFIMFGLSIWLVTRFLPEKLILVLWGLLGLLGAYFMGTFRNLRQWRARVGTLLVAYSLVLFWGAWLGETDPLKPLFQFNPWKETQLYTQENYFQTVHTMASLNVLKNTAIKEGKPVLVVFYADWCASCKQIEHAIFQKSDTRASLDNWVAIKVDVTNYNNEAQTLLKKFGLIGPPAILFFDEKGHEHKQLRIIGEVPHQTFLANLQKVTSN